MMKDQPIPTTIDDYISGFSEEIQRRLKEIRATIRAAAPEAKEAIKYSMPTFVLHRNLVHFAAHTNHIGFYPAPSGIDMFKEELARYKGAKGSVQFPYEEPVPLELIRKIVTFRVQEEFSKAESKSKKKKERS
jgi:uncharacterized protein YdhG (YjbR/CyaY superfamily)